MRDLPAIKIKNYACEDADITWQLKTVFEPLLKEDDLISLFKEIEMPLVSVLAKMEREGINLDREGLQIFSKELESSVKEIQDEIFDIAGTEFNISSPKQLGEVLFDHIKIDDKAKKTKTGQYSTSEEVLSKLKKETPYRRKSFNFSLLTKTPFYICRRSTRA